MCACVWRESTLEANKEVNTERRTSAQDPKHYDSPLGFCVVFLLTCSEFVFALARYVSPQPHGSKTCLSGRGFHTLINNVLFPSPTNVGSHNLPSWGPASSLAHRPVSSSDTICNSPIPLLTDIVRFCLLRIAVSLMVLKHVC